MTAWDLLDVVSAGHSDFSMKCDDCGSTCRRRYFRVINTETGEIRDLGSDCAWKLYGIKATDRKHVIEVEPTDAERQESLGFMLSWMNGE